MFGADVDPEGEPVDLVVTDTPDWNAEPVADINVTRIDDDTYRFDATGSTDADGEITGYEWDFGDSVTMVSGAVVEHTLAPGDFKVALVVTDDDGGLDLTTTEGTITVAEPNRASDIVIRSGGLTPDLGHADSSTMLGKRESEGWQGRTTRTSSGSVRWICTSQRRARR